MYPRDERNRLLDSGLEPIEPGGYRSHAINNYRELLKFQVKPHKIDSLQQTIYEGKTNGWLAAGSFYFALNQIHAVDFFADIIVPPTLQNIPRCDQANLCNNYSPERTQILPPQLRDFLQFGPEISYMATRLWDAKIYAENDFATVSERLALKAVDAPPNQQIHVLQNNMLNLLREMMQEQHPDPLLAQGKFGTSIMLMAERSWMETQNDLRATISQAEQQKTPITAEIMQRINDLR